MSDLEFAIVQHLVALAATNPALEGVVSTLESALGVKSSDPSAFLAQSFFPNTLDKIFDAGVESLQLQHVGDATESVKQDPKFATFEDAVKKKGFYNGVDEGSVEFLQREAKLVNKYKEKSKSVVPDTKSLEAEAEVKKGLGNTAVAEKEFEKAIELYSEALDLSPDGPNSHVYYSNRAAAHCHQSNYQAAIDDCEASLAIEPSYVKALARLGLANYFEGNYEESANAYERAVKIEPGNKSNVDALAKANAKLQKIQKASAPKSGGAGGMGGMPDMSALAGMMGGMGGGGGGLGDMMKNPAMMNMAQSMMSNPAMMAKAQEMMKDPDAMSKAMAMMGGMGGGGAPSSSGA